MEFALSKLGKDQDVDMPYRSLCSFHRVQVVLGVRVLRYERMMRLGLISRATEVNVDP